MPRQTRAAEAAEQVSYHLLNLADGRRHLSYEFESAFLYHVSRGDAESAIRAINRFDVAGEANDIGTFASSPLKQAEYGAVIAVSMICRAAIQAGVDPMVAYDHNDVYLQRISSANSAQAYVGIMYAALQEICQLIRRQQDQRNESIHITRCKQYVYHHVAQRLTVAEIAKALDLNATYLSGLFRASEGITLKEYITAEKLRGAENMLRHTDAEIGEIAQNFGFCSVSHFGDVFKSRIGMTPTAYRNRFKPVDYRKKTGVCCAPESAYKKRVQPTKGHAVRA